MLRLILKWRKFLLSLPYFKTCFGCDNIYPLQMFNKNNKKYTRPSQKGRCFNCKRCVKKYNNL